MLKNIFIVVLIIYSGYLTGQQIYAAGMQDGIQQGYDVGMKRGFDKGRDLACMIKPI